MNKKKQNMLLIGKIIIFALFAVQYVYAIWWIIHNIGVVPDFAIDSESLLYERITSSIGKGFFVIYLLQALAMYFGIRRLTPKNPWVARFAITNPLILQFVFAFVPDAFCVAMLFVLLGSLLHKEGLKAKHAIYLVFLGVLSEKYFFAGMLVILVIVVSQYIREKKFGEGSDKNSKEKLTNILSLMQVVLVVILIMVSYQTQKDVDGYTTVQQGYRERFTVQENVPTNHSIPSIAKGFITDSINYTLTPFTYLYVIDGKKRTQNSWNYINFTREEPRMSKYYMELSERNISIALALAVLASLFVFALKDEKKKIEPKYILFLATCIALSALFAATSKRGMDYRNGLFVIPIWYYLILSVFEDVHIFPEKEETKKL